MGDDTINNSASNVSITAEEGDDIISLTSAALNNWIQYTTDAGNDKIYGFNKSSTLVIGGGYGTYIYTKDDDDIIVTASTGTISLVGAASFFTTVNVLGDYKGEAAQHVKETVDNAQIINSLTGATIEALGERDSVYNYGDYTSIVGGQYNEYISNEATYVTIETNAGNDTIQNQGANSILDGGAGDDSVISWGGAAAAIPFLVAVLSSR